jgi:hypothetical protein
MHQRWCTSKQRQPKEYMSEACVLFLCSSWNGSGSRSSGAIHRIAPSMWETVSSRDKECSAMTDRPKSVRPGS